MVFHMGWVCVNSEFCGETQRGCAGKINTPQYTVLHESLSSFPGARRSMFRDLHEFKLICLKDMN